MIMILTAPREVALDIHVGLVADGDAAGGWFGYFRHRQPSPRPALSIARIREPLVVCRTLIWFCVAWVPVIIPASQTAVRATHCGNTSCRPWPVMSEY